MLSHETEPTCPPTAPAADKPLFDMGYADQVTRVLDTLNVHYQVAAGSRWPQGGCSSAGVRVGGKTDSSMAGRRIG